MNYEKLKIFIKERKPQLMTIVACGVMFVVGFGTGRAGQQPTANSLQDDYTPISATKPGAAGERTTTEEKDAATSPTTDASEKTPEKPTATSVPAGNKPVEGQPCIIKGNISSSDKIYHVQGGASYEKTTPEACFNTEAEAVAAGFRKAKR